MYGIGWCSSVRNRQVKDLRRLCRDTGRLVAFEDNIRAFYPSNRVVRVQRDDDLWIKYLEGRDMPFSGI